LLIPYTSMLERSESCSESKRSWPRQRGVLVKRKSEFEVNSSSTQLGSRCLAVWLVCLVVKRADRFLKVGQNDLLAPSDYARSGLPRPYLTHEAPRGHPPGNHASSVNNPSLEKRRCSSRFLFLPRTLQLYKPAHLLPSRILYTYHIFPTFLRARTRILQVH
jgi:hypothetical protein